jgi:uncharacterized protein VirK/YbjX
MKTLIKTLLATAPRVHPAQFPRPFFNRAKYCLRGLASARDTKAWFALLRTPKLAVIAQNHPYVYCKLQRPYLNRTLDTRQRLETLQHHYRFVSERFSAAMMHQVYASSSGLTLAMIDLEEVGKFALVLDYGWHEKEGDLTISLKDDRSGELLFTLSFCISNSDNGGQEIFIGGLQGNRKTHDKELTIAMTRGLFGMRPKALVFFALQQLATIWGVNHLRAISDDTHIYRHAHKRKDLLVRYDDFWIECGGTLAQDGMFDLPIIPLERDIAALKPNKRQMYKRRYVKLAAVATEISVAWQSL